MILEHLSDIKYSVSSITIEGSPYMKKAARLCFGIMLTLFIATHAALAQDARGTLSGTVRDSSGHALPNVKVSIKNLATGDATEAQTDSSGHYSVSNLLAGDYEISVSAEGSGVATAKVSLAVGSQQTADLAVTSVSTTAPANPPATAPSENLPDAPSSSSQTSSSQSSASQTEPSLSDLGFSASDTQANAHEQALLDKRTHMLKIHQRMGLITTIPLVATVISSAKAGGRSESTSSRDLHVALGSLTGDLYGITAYYAIRAPRIKGTEKRGPIRFHEAMAWIHGPGMILTPILGAMAFNQKNNGEKVHGIAAAHGPVAIVTAGAFGAALLSVSVKF